MAAASLAGLLLLALLLAPEFGESAQIRTLDDGGTYIPTRVWFVEDGNDLIVRSERDSSWLARLRARPAGDIVRPGKRDDFRARFIESRSEVNAWNRRFREKYGVLDVSRQLRRAILPSQPWVMVRLSPPPGLPRYRR